MRDPGLQKGIEIRMEPGDAEILKNGTADFCTFRCCMSNGMTADDQKNKAGGNRITGVAHPPLKASDRGLHRPGQRLRRRRAVSPKPEK